MRQSAFHALLLVVTILQFAGSARADRFTHAKGGELVKGKLLGKVVQDGKDMLLVKTEDGKQRFLPSTEWKIEREEVPKKVPPQPSQKRTGGEGVNLLAGDTVEFAEEAGTYKDATGEMVRLSKGTRLRVIAVKDTEVLVGTRGGTFDGWLPRSAVKLAPVDEALWSGFRGITWAASVAGIEGMTFVGTRPSGSKLYVRKDDKMAIGDAELVKVVYSFHKDRFFDVEIEFKGTRNLGALRSAIEENHGERDGRTHADNDAVLWYWEHKEVRMRLEYNNVTGIGRLCKSYWPIMKEAAAEAVRLDAQRGKEARKDF